MIANPSIIDQANYVMWIAQPEKRWNSMLQMTNGLLITMNDDLSMRYYIKRTG